jgi:hypothetical protein
MTTLARKIQEQKEQEQIAKHVCDLATKRMLQDRRRYDDIECIGTRAREEEE